MKSRPILFNGPMVQAILDGWKTVTRRIIKLPPGIVPSDVALTRIQDGFLDGQRPVFGIGDEPNAFSMRCPYGQSGDRLWVRETWRIDGLSRRGALEIGRRHTDGLSFRADMEGDRSCDDCPWIPSIHMPRWASRITLEIVRVRVERLQDITNGDAKLEGADCMQELPGFNVETHQCGHCGKTWDKHIGHVLVCPPAGSGKLFDRWTHRGHFANIWESIYGPGSWEANPWVWVVEFRRVEK